MKVQNIFKYLIVAFLATQLAACDKTDTEQKFEQSPTERLNNQEKELNDLLLSSEQGWKAVYFTDNTQLGGYTHIFKFTADGKVTMASDFDADTKPYTSEYDVVLGSTVSLLFNTNNRIHLLSDSNNFPTPDLKGEGYKGDFQFLYYGQENGEIIFKTNRSFQELRFVKATAQDWADLPKNIAMIPNVVGASTRPLFRLLETNDGTKTTQFDFNFTGATRYATANSIETGSNITSNMGIAYTPTGIIVSPPVKVGNQNLTDFTYDSATGAFTATGTNNVTATIKYSNKPLVLTDDYKILLEGKGNPPTGFAYIAANLATAPSNSLLCNTLLNQVNAQLSATQKLSRVQFTFNNPAFGSYIEYRFNGGKTTIYHNVTVTEDSVNKTLKLNHVSWENNLGAIIAEPALLKNIDKELLDNKGLYVKKELFKITFSNTIYTFTSASSNFRLTTYAFQ